MITDLSLTSLSLEKNRLGNILLVEENMVRRSPWVVKKLVFNYYHIIAELCMRKTGLILYHSLIMRK